jgi:PKD repeat protein
MKREIKPRSPKPFPYNWLHTDQASMHLRIVTALFILLTLYPLMSRADEQCGFDRRHEWLLEHDPEYRRWVAEQDTRLQTHMQGFLPAVIPSKPIPVVVHVIHRGEPVGTGSNISDAQIHSAITALNEDFRKKPGTNGDGNGVDVGMEFCLAVRDPADHPTSGIIRVDGRTVANYATDGIVDEDLAGGNELEVKGLSRWPNTDNYNIWIVSEINGAEDHKGTQGYAYFPGAGDTWTALDGAVILYDAFGTTGTLKDYTNLNRTVTHELGHGFDLYHTFEGGSCFENNCKTEGDFCCDTPPHPGLNTDCDTPECNGKQQVENYMDYTGQECQNMFTGDQRDRMLTSLDITPRASLLASDGCDPVAAPVSDFSFADPTCTGTVQFIDQSSNGPTGWEWTFEGGNPAVSSGLPNPAIDYTTPGTYPVSLTARNSIDTGNTANKNITIYNPPAVACPVIPQGTLNSIGITNVSLKAIDNSTWSAQQDGGSLDFSCTQTTNLEPNVDYPLSVSTAGDNEDVRVYIDFNNNGSFSEPDEQVFASDNSGPNHSGTLYSPSIFVSNTLLRMRVISDWYPNTITPCGSPQYGQAEDYGVVYGARQVPESDFTADTTATCIGPVHFQNRSRNGSNTWGWSFPGGTPADSTEQNPTVSYDTAGLYSVSLTAENEIGTGNQETKQDFIQVFNPPPAPSCTPTTSTYDNSGYHTGIQSVSLNTIQSNTGDAYQDNQDYGGEGYLDFSCSRTSTLAPSTDYLISIMVGDVNKEYVSVYIDYNNNGIFEATELAYDSTVAATGEHTGTITTPTAPVFNQLLRLRVMSDFQSITNSCSSPAYGQVEDYGVIFRLPGDINYDDQVDLRDALLALQVMARLSLSEAVHLIGDVNNNGRIDLADVIFILQKIAGLRP